jgi:hypothetical protein
MRAKGLDTAAVKGNDRGAEARPIWIHGITNTPSMNLRLTHPNRKLVEQQFGPVHTCRFPKDTPRSDLVDGTPEWEGKDFPWQRIPEVKDLEALDMYVSDTVTQSPRGRCKRGETQTGKTQNPVSLLFLFFPLRPFRLLNRKATVLGSLCTFVDHHLLC